MERTWVIVSMLDITGFRSWTYRAGTYPEIKEHFIQSFYRVLQCYVKNHPDTWIKYEGDGLLVIREFGVNERKKKKPLITHLLGLRGLLRKVLKVIRTSENAPENVRIRHIGGYAYKFMVLDPNDVERKRMIPEFLEYCTNTVRGLLDVNPEIRCLATEDLVKTLGKGRSSFRVRSLGKPSCYPKGINSEDIEGLKILKF